jgi:hypothetical protein
MAAGVGMIASASADHRNRQERREAIVAGAVRNEIATERAEDRYRECMRGSNYDEDCARQRWKDEEEARRKARRTAIIVGAQ